MGRGGTPYARTERESGPVSTGAASAPAGRCACHACDDRAGAAGPDRRRHGCRAAVGRLEAQVWETPGHCADHVTYWFAQAGLVCAGDTLFTLGCGRVMESPPETLYRSLRRFDDLPDATQVFSGHDYVLSNARFALAADPDNPDLRARLAEAERAQAEGRFLIPSTMGAERATNPFLRSGQPALAKSVDLPPQSDPETVFVALRAWKNRF